MRQFVLVWCWHSRSCLDAKPFRRLRVVADISDKESSVYRYTSLPPTSDFLEVICELLATTQVVFQLVEAIMEAAPHLSYKAQRIQTDAPITPLHTRKVPY